MLATLIIVFRELIEAGIIIGVVMTATRGVPYRGRWVIFGVSVGLLGACVVAMFADVISGMMEGMGQELFNAGVLLLAVAMLTWHNVWMAKHGKAIAGEMREVGDSITTGNRSLYVLAIVIGLAVLREGSEVVLFLYGIAISGSESARSMMTGGALGFVLGAGLSILMYWGLIVIPMRYLFKVTSWLIALLAAGMAAQSVIFLQQAGLIDSFAKIVWDTSSIMSQDGAIGSVLHTLVGYSDRPNQLQLIAYVSTLIMIFGLMKIFSGSRVMLNTKSS